MSAPTIPSAPAIPAEPPIGGVFWSLLVPAALLLVAVLATAWLYRHFAGRPED